VSDLSTLPGGNKWHSYSGSLSGGPTLPATVELVKIPSTGLKDSYVKVVPFYGAPIAVAAGDALGLKILINEVVVYEEQRSEPDNTRLNTIEVFVAQQSELQILSLNTNNNSLQQRGVMVLGWWL